MESATYLYICGISCYICVPRVQSLCANKKYISTHQFDAHFRHRRSLTIDSSSKAPEKSLKQCLSDVVLPISSIAKHLSDRITDLDSQEVMNRCQEIKDSDVNKCPVQHLRMVLEEGTSVPLRGHQRNAVKRFRASVEDGAAGVTRMVRCKVRMYVQCSIGPDVSR